MEMRPQHELQLITKKLGAIRGLLVLSSNGKQETSAPLCFNMEEFPEPEEPVVEEKKPVAEGEEDAAEEQ
eukprot:CAMPEP_0176361770 /NCGR_PEP_ID=MMETSP0126-20121128/17977_1 /TAXON_ID=141414 ORGANISM="Strombidinopsis acuminatum, Strain SPMC142" /NCGR_SAMPLE_ID=MMETSP0126 /ASSEMBLY_ACC=CAM_ASM_000229 /LENGTH=69 /DNA_ID=CAMNT_0017717453 /DNA_START=2471 /DNA_END=2680 /DNA_ORIENTATION=+